MGASGWFDNLLKEEKAPKYWNIDYDTDLISIFVPVQITCLNLHILTVVAFQGIFSTAVNMISLHLVGTSFSRFGAFAADSDYPYYPHHPEPHFFVVTKAFYNFYH